jgi:hypothetical protein
MKITRIAVPVFILLFISQSAYALNCGKAGQRPCTVLERIPSCDRGLVENFAKKRCERKKKKTKKVVRCGALNQRPCKVFERVPSCNKGLKEDFRRNRCIKPRKLACGARNQRPCKITERIPSCNKGLKEDFGKNRCVKPGELSCGRRHQRPCTIVERIPSCNRGLVEDLKYRKCLKYSESSGKEMERFVQQVMSKTRNLGKAQKEIVFELFSARNRNYFVSGQFLKDVKRRRFKTIEKRIGLARIRQRISQIKDPMTPKALTIGFVSDAGMVAGITSEHGIAINLTGRGRPVEFYRTMGINAGVITGGSYSIAVGLWWSTPQKFVGEGRGFAFGGGKVVNPVTGISVGGAVAVWFAPRKDSPGALVFDHKSFQGISISLGAGASLLPVDGRASLSLTQIWKRRGFVADACGALKQRPCHIIERVPSCKKPLRENFLWHRCER